MDGQLALQRGIRLGWKCLQGFIILFARLGMLEKKVYNIDRRTSKIIDTKKGVAIWRPLFLYCANFKLGS